MNQKRLLLVLAVLFSVSAVSVFAQAQKTIQYFNSPQGYRTFGIDAGLSYQSSDVKSVLGGWGLGMTYEKNLLHTPQGLLDFGLRGRALYTNSLGIDNKISRGFRNNTAVNGTYNALANYTPDSLYIANYRNDMGELSLEGVLTFNRLRTNKGIYATLFGGLGLNGHSVRVDQVNEAANARYNYKALGNNPTVTDVRSLLDGTFETAGDGFKDSVAFNFMPNIGVELGLQVTPRFAIALGHKMTFTQTDRFDGQQWLNNNTVGIRNDIHHYTNLQLKWVLEAQRLTEDPPKITVLQPSISPYNALETTENIRARVENVTNKSDIVVLVNGRSARFDFVNTNLTFEARDLVEGDNKVLITATNNFGSDQKEIILFYRKNPTRVPTVQFIVPTSYAETTENNYDIKVKIGNVSDRRDLTLTVNGRTNYNFSFNGSELTANIGLETGRNAVVVTAKNSAGQATDAITINSVQKPPVNKPVVRITNTGTPTPQTNGCVTNFIASVEGVNSRNDISVRLNGTPIFDFEYDFAARILRGGLNLRNGSNTLTVTARNEGGESQDQATILCSEPRPAAPPVVRINSPSEGEISQRTNMGMSATVTNINSNSQVQVFVNGNRVSDVTYYSFDRTVTANITANIGTNTLTVRATNADGSDEKSVRFTVEAPRPIAPTVRIQEPANGSTVGNAAVRLVAYTTYVTDRSQVRVQLNGVDVPGFDFSSYNNTVSARLTLKEGYNDIKVSVSTAGGRDEAMSSVVYNIPPMPPTVVIDRPGNGSRTENSTIDFEATTTQITDKNQVRLFLNGADITGFTFDRYTYSRNVKARLTLNEGNNVIRIVASNKDGVAEKMANVVYSKPVYIPKPPTVRIAQPANGAQLTAPDVAFNATTTQVNNRSQIALTLNGNAVNNFTFDAYNGSIKANLTLEAGNNVVRVQVTNVDGTADDMANIVYKPYVPQPPTVRITQPTTGSTVKNPAANFAAQTTNVSDRNRIAVTLNNAPVTGFTFNPTTQQVTAALSLREGSNTIAITVTNNDGRNSASTSVTYTPVVIEKNPPTVRISQPVDGSVRDNNAVRLLAQTTQISDRSGISVTLNGTAVSNITFNAGSQQVTVPLVLKEGANVVVVTATNADGQASAQATVTYKSAKKVVTPDDDNGGSVVESAPEILNFKVSQPVIDVMNPRPPVSSITADVRSLNAGSVQLFVDGSPVANTRFNANTGQFSAEYTVQGGRTYTFLLRATNGGGTVEKQQTVKF